MVWDSVPSSTTALPGDPWVQHFIVQCLSFPICSTDLGDDCTEGYVLLGLKCSEILRWEEPGRTCAAVLLLQQSEASSFIPLVFRSVSSDKGGYRRPANLVQYASPMLQVMKTFPVNSIPHFHPLQLVRAEAESHQRNNVWEAVFARSHGTAFHPPGLLV